MNDIRFKNKHELLLKSTAYPLIYRTSVDIKKVNAPVLQAWIQTTLEELVGFDDEVLSEYTFSLLLEEPLDPKHVQVSLTGFLEQKTVAFMKLLWTLLIDAQESPSGVPKSILEKKKLEIEAKRLELITNNEVVGNSRDYRKERIQQEDRINSYHDRPRNDRNDERRPSRSHSRDRDYDRGRQSRDQPRRREKSRERRRERSSSSESSSSSDVSVREKRSDPLKNTRDNRRDRDPRESYRTSRRRSRSYSRRRSHRRSRSRSRRRSDSSSESDQAHTISKNAMNDDVVPFETKNSPLKTNDSSKMALPSKTLQGEKRERSTSPQAKRSRSRSSKSTKKSRGYVSFSSSESD